MDVDIQDIIHDMENKRDTSSDEDRDIDGERTFEAERDRYMTEHHRRRAVQNRAENSDLNKTLTKFMQHGCAKHFVIEDSATLRLVKALHELEFEDVISSIGQGARINIKVR